ncbi:hypothetical protein [Bifidobacterium choerinum]|nr:hypothetical protein [Bifidobacterium choerinum]
MNTRSIAKASAAVFAAIAMLGVGGLTAGTALADDPSASPSAPFTPTANAGTIIIHDAPAPSDGGTNDLVPASVNGRTFTAYELGSYADVQVTGSSVTSMNLVNAPGVTNADVMAWIKAAAQGVNAANTSDDQLKLLDANNKIVYQGGSFVGDATNMSPLQFVARYFYGAGADKFSNDHANNKAMRLFAKAAQATLGAACSTVTTHTATGAQG